MSTRRKQFVRVMVCELILILGACQPGSALWNANSEKAEPSVKELLDKLNKGDFIAKIYVLDELGKLGPKAKAAVPTLIKVLENDKTPIPGADEAVKTESIARPEDANPSLRSAAAATLGKIGPDAKPAIPVLLKSIKDKDKYVRSVSAQALAGIGVKEDKILSALKQSLDDPDADVRINAANALAEFDPERQDAVSALTKLLKDKDPNKRRSAANALAYLPSAKINTAIPDLINGLKDAKEDVRAEIAGSLGFICEESEEVVPALVESLEKDTSSKVRVQAAQGLREYGPEAKSAIPALTHALENDPSVDVQNAATQSIRHISTMPAKRGRKVAEEEFERMVKEHPELMKDADIRIRIEKLRRRHARENR